MRVSIFATLAACLAACGSGENTDFVADAAREDSAEFVTEAKAAAAHDLRDPSTAQIRELRLGEWGGNRVLCGEVNGKNAYGAYAGFTGFVAKASMLGEVTADTASDGRSVEAARPCIQSYNELTNEGGSGQVVAEMNKRGCSTSDFDLMFWTAQYDLYCKSTTALAEGT